VTLYYQDDHVTLYHGDCTDVMASLPAESVDAVVTSPPYAMQRRNTYGGIPEKDYPAWTVAWMDEARRVLKPDGSVIINIRPHIKNGQISDYTLRTRLALRESGWVELEELIWFKRSSPPAGRVDRPRRSWESLHWFGRQGKVYATPKAAGDPLHTQFRSDPAKQASTLHIRNGWGSGVKGSNEWRMNGGTARVRDVAEVNLGRKTELERANPHPATYPWQLAEWCGKLICPPGGTILDPFSGSASTGVAALRNGWNYIGIDSVEEYVEMSARRLAAERAAFA